MYSRELLQNNLDKLRKNRENISIEELETKYVKPYKALLKDIKIQHREMFFDILKNICIDKNEIEQVGTRFQQTCDLIDKKLYEEYDVDGAESILRNFVSEEFDKRNIVLRLETVDENGERKNSYLGGKYES